MNWRVPCSFPVVLIAAGVLGCGSYAPAAWAQTPSASTATTDQDSDSRSASASPGAAAADDAPQPQPAEPPLYASRRTPFELQKPRYLNINPFAGILPGVYLPPDPGMNSGEAMDPEASSSRADRNAPPPGELGRAQVAEDANQPNSNFPPWALYSTQDDTDPRVRPNAGFRLRRRCPPLNEVLCNPNFSPIVPDFDHTIMDTRHWSMKVSLAEFGVYTDPRSAKFNEFRDVGNGLVSGFEAHYRGSNGAYLNSIGRELGRRDADLNVEGGIAGKFIVTFYDWWVPHNYMFGARSLYSGVGTGNLTIADSIRTDVQNSTSITDADTKLLAYDAQQGTSIDESLERKKIGGEIQIVKTYPWLIKIGGQDESRNGERPWSASFGFSEFVEIPWAVHYDQDEIHISAEWNKPQSRFYFLAGFRASIFDDHVQTQNFSNPFRVTDSADEVGTYDGGPAAGRIPLYPSNESYEPSAMLVVKDLPWRSTLSWTLATALGYQNQRLVPFSTNTSDTVYNTAGTAFNATDLAALPRPTANASINSENTQVRWTAEPSDHLHLNLEYRAFRNDVTTPRFVIADFVREDQDVRTPVNQCVEPCAANYTFSPLPIGYTRQTGTVTADYDFGHDNRLGFTYMFESWDRRYREVKDVDDNRLRVSYDSKAKKWLDLKSWYEHTIRTASSYNFNERHTYEGDAAEATALPGLHKFDEAPYTKDDMQIMATFTLNDSSSISTHGLFGKTSYTGQTFGLLNNSHQAYGADYTYDPNDRISFFAEYDYEKFHNRIENRTFYPGSACDPYSSAPGYASYCNWGGVPEDTYNTAGIGVDAYFTKKLHTTIYYTLSKNQGTENFISTLGPNSTVDLNFFTPQNFTQVDSVTYHTINQELEYKFTKMIALSAGYQYEFWHDNDFNYNGFSYVNQFESFNYAPFNGIGGSNLLMGGLLPPGYHANIAYFRVKFGI